MLDEVIAMTIAETPSAYRARQADWWTNEARACAALGMDDLAATCQATADGWRRGGEIRWFEGEP